jgi:hypothetical protein
MSGTVVQLAVEQFNDIIEAAESVGDAITVNTELLNVPIPNNTDNETIRDLIGNKLDSSMINTATATMLSYLKASYYHAHGENIVYPQDGTFFKTVTSDATAYTHGAKVEIIPANAVDKAFDLHWAEIEDVSDVGDYELKLWSGLANQEVEIGAYRFGRSTAQARDTSKAVLVCTDSRKHENICNISLFSFRSKNS